MNPQQAIHQKLDAIMNFFGIGKTSKNKKQKVNTMKGKIILKHKKNSNA